MHLYTHTITLTSQKYTPFKSVATSISCHRYADKVATEVTAWQRLKKFCDFPTGSQVSKSATDNFTYVMVVVVVVVVPITFHERTRK